MTDIVYGMQVDLDGDDKVRSQMVALEKQSDKTADANDKLGKEAVGAGDGIAKMGDEADTASKKVSKKSSVIKGLFDNLFSLKGLIASIGLLAFANDIVFVGNQVEGWANGMFAVTESHQLANVELLKTRSFAKELGLDIASTTQSYISLAAATRDTALEGDATRDIFEAVSGTMRVLNRSAYDTEGALRAIEQMISKGNVQAEELRGQLGERLPGAFILAAKAMGVTTQELNKMLEQGEVLAADLLPALADELNNKFGPGLENALKGPAQQLRELTNQWFELREALSAELFDEIAASAVLLVDGLALLTDNLPFLLDSLQLLSTLLLTIATVRAAQYVAGLGVMTAATSVMTVATTALSTAMAFIGGPVGLIALAAVAFVSFAATLRETKSDIDVLTGGVLDLSNELDSFANKDTFDKFQKNQANILDVSSTIEQKTRQINELKASLDELRNDDVGVIGQGRIILELENDISQLTRETNALIEKRGELMDANSELAGVEENLSRIQFKELESLEALRANYESLLEGLDPTIKKSREYAETLDTLNELKQLSIITVSEFNNALGLLNNKYKDSASANTLLIASLKQQNADLALSADALAIQTELRKLDATATDAQREAVTSLVEARIDAQANQQNEDVLASLEDELALSKLLGENLAVETALRELNSKATAEQRAEVEALARAIYQQNEATSALDLSDLTSQVDDFGDAWSNVGNVIVDTFGDIADQLNQFNAQQTDYISQMDAIAERRKLVSAVDDVDARTQALKELSALETALTEQNLRNQLSAFGQIAGTAVNMLDEQSRAREILHKAEVVYTGIEIALALNKAIANAKVAISNQGGGDPYTAFGRIAAMAGIMAAIGVFSGSVGGSYDVGQVQASQGTGTVIGASDEQSSSITAASERFEDIAIDQLAELRGIRSSLSSLSDGISQLTVSLVSGGTFGGGSQGVISNESVLSNDVTTGLVALSTGGLGLLLDDALGGIISDTIGGIFGQVEREVLDSGIDFMSQTLGQIFESGELDAQTFRLVEETTSRLFGLIENSSRSTDYTLLETPVRQSMADIFGFIGDSVLQSAQLLGFETVNIVEQGLVNDVDLTRMRDSLGESFSIVTQEMELSLEDALSRFTLDIPDISFEGLSGEEIEQQLEAVFSQQADLIAEYLVPSITQYQQIGEGAFETLTRVAREQAIFNDAIASLGLTLEGLDNEQLIAAAQNIIGIFGDIESFSDSLGTYYSEFYSESEQFDVLQQSLVDVLDSVNLSLPNTREGFRELVDGLDLTTDAGQELFALLLEISPAAAAYYDALEELNSALDEGEQLLENRLALENDWAEDLLRLGLDTYQTQLRDLEQWYAEQLALAQEYEANTTNLTALYNAQREAILQAQLDEELAALQAAADTRNSLNAGLADDIARFDLSGLALDLYDLQQRFEAELSEFEAAGADVSLLETFYGRQRQSLIDAYMQDINDDTAEQLADLASEHETAVSSLTSEYDSLFATMDSISTSISSSVLSVRRAMSGFDEIAYQQNQVALFTGQLGGGDVDTQLANLSNLHDATNAYYDAQIAGLNAQRDAAQALYDEQVARYEEELAYYEQVRDAIASLSDFADSLLLGSASNLTLTEQRDVAREQYDSLLAAANGGDLTALQNLSGSAQSYLDIASQFYGTGSSEYADIFDAVQNDLRGISAPDAPTAPSVPDEITNHQAALERLQSEQIVEITSIQTEVDVLRATTQSEFARELAALETGFSETQAAIIAAGDAQLAELVTLNQNVAEFTATLIDVIGDITSPIDDSAGVDDPGGVVYTPVITEPIYDIGPVIDPIGIAQAPTVTTQSAATGSNNTATTQATVETAQSNAQIAAMSEEQLTMMQEQIVLLQRIVDNARPTLNSSGTRRIA